MAFKYKTEHFIKDELEPTLEPQKTLSDIVHIVKYRLADALDDKSVGLSGLHPRVIISMVVTNILVNLLYNCVHAPDVPSRLEMVRESLEEVNQMAYELWNSLEANRADTSIAH